MYMLQNADLGIENWHFPVTLSTQFFLFTSIRFMTYVIPILKQT